MDIWQIEEALKSMVVIADTREQDTERARRRYEDIGIEVQRHTISYGDYCYNLTLNDRKLYNTDETIEPVCVIERKMSLDELAQCFCHERKRFEAEMVRAKEHGARIVLLTEGATWENLLNGKYRSKFNPAAYKASLLAFMVRYDIQLIFCKPETTGKLIHDILYRDAKERLERGEFDERLCIDSQGNL